MSRAGQTIVVVRNDEAHLATDVAAALPIAAARARAANRRADVRDWRRPGARICPICGGDKTSKARRCAKCRDAAMRAAHGSRLAASRSLIVDASITAHPGAGHAADTGPGWGSRKSGRVHGEGRPQPQPPRPRMIKRPDGRWEADES